MLAQRCSGYLLARSELTANVNRRPRLLLQHKRWGFSLFTAKNVLLMDSGLVINHSVCIVLGYTVYCTDSLRSCAARPDRVVRPSRLGSVRWGRHCSAVWADRLGGEPRVSFHGSAVAGVNYRTRQPAMSLDGGSLWLLLICHWEISEFGPNICEYVTLYHVSFHEKLWLRLLIIYFPKLLIYSFLRHFWCFCASWVSLPYPPLLMNYWLKLLITQRCSSFIRPRAINPVYLTVIRVISDVCCHTNCSSLCGCLDTC